jgi:hypothetical protein
MWIDGENVIFREGGPQKMPGWVSPVTVTGAGVIRGMDALQDEAAVQRLFMGDANSLYMWDGSTLSTISTGHTGQINETVTANATTWSFARFGNWMLATNDVDPARIWKTGVTDAALAGASFTRARILLKHGPHIVALNTDNGQNIFEWCNEDLPEDWSITATNSAGNLNIRDMDGPITAAINFGNQIAIFGKNQMFLSQNTGAPFYFNYNMVATGIGCIGTRGVIEVNRRLYGFSKTGVWMSDGVGFEYIDTPKVREYIQENADLSQLSKVFVSYNAALETVEFHFPTSATKENTFALTYRIPNQSWSKLAIGRTSAVPTDSVFGQPVMVDINDDVQFHNEGVNADGGGMTSWIRTKPADLGQPAQWKEIHKILTQVKNLTGTFQVRVGYQVDTDDAISWTGYQSVADGFDVTYWRTAGRFISLEFRSTEAGAHWHLTGIEGYGWLRGKGV